MRINNISPVNILFQKSEKKRFKNGILVDQLGERYTGRTVHTANNNDKYLIDFNNGVLAQSILISNTKFAEGKKYVYDNKGKLRKILCYDKDKKLHNKILINDKKITKITVEDVDKERVTSIIRFNDKTIPFGADVSISKESKKYPDYTFVKYYKNSKLIASEEINKNEQPNLLEDGSIHYIESNLFDRTNGNRYRIRRYASGKTNILISGDWNNHNNYEYESRDANGETIGYTKRNYIKKFKGSGYFTLGKYYTGDINYVYEQTEFDKDKNIKRISRRMQTEDGKFI